MLGHKFLTSAEGQRILNKIIVCFGFLLNVGCNIYYDSNNDAPNVWFFGNAFAFVCYTYVIYRVYPSFVTSVILAATSSQLIDEIVGDAINGSIKEWALFGLIIIVLYSTRKKKSKFI